MLEPPDLEAPPLDKIVKDVSLDDADLSFEQKGKVTKLLDKFKHIFGAS